MTRLTDVDALLKDITHRYCENCERRKGTKNGKQKFIYDIGEAPCRACPVDDMKDELENAPTVDAEPVRYGRWQVNETNGHKDMTCPSCGWLFEYYDGLEEEWNYCPHCGALQSFATERHINTVRNADV